MMSGCGNFYGNSFAKGLANGVLYYGATTALRHQLNKTKDEKEIKTMADKTTEKRKFYGTGDAKGFTKEIFYQTVKAMIDGEDVDTAKMELVAKACEYELEGIANRPKAAAGEKKDPLQSDYAKALRAAIVPLIDNTPKSATELSALATTKGRVAPSGKPFTGPWVVRVLNNEPGIVKVNKIVEKVDAKGLKRQEEVTAYKRG